MIKARIRKTCKFCRQTYETKDILSECCEVCNKLPSNIIKNTKMKGGKIKNDR